MNKTEFVEELSKRLNLSIEDCTKINEILEKNFFISRSNKEKIIKSLIEEFKIEETRANEIYNESVIIITKEIKNKLIHPFGK